MKFIMNKMIIFLNTLKCQNKLNKDIMICIHTQIKITMKIKKNKEKKQKKIFQKYKICLR